jgi:hypothetical protein
MNAGFAPSSPRRLRRYWRRGKTARRLGFPAPRHPGDRRQRSGKTTTIGQLDHLLREQDYGVMLAAGDTSAPPRSSSEDLGRADQSAGDWQQEGGDAAGIVYDSVRQACDRYRR